MSHLREVVGLDATLCPPAIDELTAEDWLHDSGLGVAGIFDSLEYARHRTPLVPALQLLAVAHEPTQEEFDNSSLPEFRFMGFDLVEAGGSTSALTNCGGFPMTFRPLQLSSEGLIRSRLEAYAVREALRTQCPNEPHAKCHAWAIWRWTGA